MGSKGDEVEFEPVASWRTTTEAAPGRFSAVNSCLFHLVGWAPPTKTRWWAVPTLQDAEHGMVKRSRNDFDRAIADFTKAIPLIPRILLCTTTDDPKDPIVYNNRGVTWLNMGSYDQAIADCDTAIRLDPDNTTAHTQRDSALALRTRGNSSRGNASAMNRSSRQREWLHP
jgi:tetratricopeptide (TPR) repeat protein